MQPQRPWRWSIRNNVIAFEYKIVPSGNAVGTIFWFDTEIIEFGTEI